MNLKTNEMKEQPDFLEATMNWTAAKIAKMGALATVGSLGALALVYFCPTQTAHLLQLPSNGSSDEALKELQSGLSQFTGYLASVTLCFKMIGNQWSPETRQVATTLVSSKDEPLLNEVIQYLKKSR